MYLFIFLYGFILLYLESLKLEYMLGYSYKLCTCVGLGATATFFCVKSFFEAFFRIASFFFFSVTFSWFFVPFITRVCITMFSGCTFHIILSFQRNLWSQDSFSVMDRKTLQQCGTSIYEILTINNEN